MKTVNYGFRERLNKVLGGFSHNYCYQCGACVADCPAHQRLNEFNPRTIILNALFGFEEELTGPDALIWNCTNCYNCHERCPQMVSPIEVIIALKNISCEKGTNPSSVKFIVDRVKGTGATVSFTSLSRKRREELRLPRFTMDCLDNLNKIMKS